MNKVMSEVLFNRAVLFFLFAFECAGRGGDAFSAIGAALSICAILNMGRSIKACMGDD